MTFNKHKILHHFDKRIEVWIFSPKMKRKDWDKIDELELVYAGCDNPHTDYWDIDFYYCKKKDREKLSQILAY